MTLDVDGDVLSSDDGAETTRRVNQCKDVDEGVLRHLKDKHVRGS